MLFQQYFCFQKKKNDQFLSNNQKQQEKKEKNNVIFLHTTLKGPLYTKTVSLDLRLCPEGSYELVSVRPSVRKFFYDRFISFFWNSA